jgi:hypothetical protein
MTRGRRLTLILSGRRLQLVKVFDTLFGDVGFGDALGQPVGLLSGAAFSHAQPS